MLEINKRTETPRLLTPTSGSLTALKNSGARALLLAKDITPFLEKLAQNKSILARNAFSTVLINDNIREEAGSLSTGLTANELYLTSSALLEHRKNIITNPKISTVLKMTSSSLSSDKNTLVDLSFPVSQIMNPKVAVIKRAILLLKVLQVSSLDFSNTVLLLDAGEFASGELDIATPKANASIGVLLYMIANNSKFPLLKKHVNPSSPVLEMLENRVLIVKNGSEFISVTKPFLRNKFNQLANNLTADLLPTAPKVIKRVNDLVLNTGEQSDNVYGDTVRECLIKYVKRELSVDTDNDTVNSVTSFSPIIGNRSKDLEAIAKGANIYRASSIEVGTNLPDKPLVKVNVTEYNSRKITFQWKDDTGNNVLICRDN